MARRLVEAGVELVTVTLNGPLCGRVGNWDDHAANHNVFEGMKHRTPFFAKDDGTPAERLRALP